VLVLHATALINSLAHTCGSRRYATGDDSRNNPLLAVLTLGEGWHNNHHRYMSSARQGFFWWEYDPTYYALKVLSWVGLVRDLKTPPRQVLAAARVRDGSFDMGMFKVHWAKATAALAAARPWDRAGADVEAAIENDVEADHRTRREQLEARLRDSRAALESYVHGSMQSAEELAKLSRRHQRAAVAD
jgi:stearoyl-CoA desaturase (delta-9 desaturase)